MKIKINSTEIIDNCHSNENSEYQPSEISVLVEFEYKGVPYYLDFQTTTTYDYAYSSKLSPYSGTDSYNDLEDACGYEFDDIVEKIAEKSKCADKWKTYVDENYERNN